MMAPRVIESVSELTKGEGGELEQLLRTGEVLGVAKAKGWEPDVYPAVYPILNIVGQRIGELERVLPLGQ